MGYYTTYSEYLSRRFPGIGKLQKIGVSLGTSCPNRDGTIGTGGCAYCNNSSFTPSYQISTKDISEALAKGKTFFSRKYPEMKYLAYFQSYTNTHGLPLDRLMNVYHLAAETDDVVGLIIGTLERVNRCHTWETTVDAVHRTAKRGLSTGLHFIMGLPGETNEMMLRTVDRAIALPIDTLKFHQLQIIRGTRLEKEYLAGAEDLRLFTPEEYLDLAVRIVRRVPRSIAIERFVSQSPPELLVAPRWDLKNYQFVNLLNNRLGAIADTTNID